MLLFETILHPTDFSDCSMGAFDVACTMARDSGARLAVVHVTSSLMVAVPTVTIPADPVDVRELILNQLAKFQPNQPGVRMDRNLREGDPATEILRFAQEIHCDLIVMGTHGRSGLGRLLMGSVAEEVLRKALCPVLTVKSHVPIVVPVPKTQPAIAMGG